MHSASPSVSSARTSGTWTDWCAPVSTVCASIPRVASARALELRPGRALDADTLLLELEAARYGQSADAIQPGSYVRDGNSFLIQTRAFVDGGGAQPSRRIRVTLANRRIGKLEDVAAKRALESVKIDPARIATLYGKARQERRLVKLDEVPPLFLRTLLAVEDKGFRDPSRHRPLGHGGRCSSTSSPASCRRVARR
ncbi:MAG: hypothetical protein IPH50_09800 [Rhodanobacteraceae bacterium]|nr:hypothetical protein [Rhodanobacteraceae bacterium]